MVRYLLFGGVTQRTVQNNQPPMKTYCFAELLALPSGRSVDEEEYIATRAEARAELCHETLNAVAGIHAEVGSRAACCDMLCAFFQQPADTQGIKFSAVMSVRMRLAIEDWIHFIMLLIMSHLVTRILDTPKWPHDAT